MTGKSLPFARPEIMARALDDPRRARSLRAAPLVDGYAPDRAQGQSRLMRAEINDRETAAARDLGRVDWVDADHKGDALWSARGQLFQLAGPTRRGMNVDAEPKMVADLNDMTFAAIEAPRRAMKWP